MLWGALDSARPTDLRAEPSSGSPRSSTELGPMGRDGFMRMVKLRGGRDVVEVDIKVGLSRATLADLTRGLHGSTIKKEKKGAVEEEEAVDVKNEMV